ncbi:MULTISPECIES: HTH domain-containing protein [unclassified Sphingomonas]|uniref:HTH domain-containing protein n=1 Tax=unclassified Sphingomonas TaxID=196159 RepID=UPI0002D7FAE1|nr:MULTISPECIES: hypothetical protein [unclassified Sphingomonas]KTF67839.1 hypothetical protein ATB93_16080 [Sphingomonas sp. WG]
MVSAPQKPRLSANPESDHAFYELGPRRFEHFARALHETEPHIFGTSLYAPDGQEQFGIDHVAFYRGPEGHHLQVGQAKAEKKFGSSDIREAADKFLQYWESHWRDRNVQRFVLFVGCNIKSRQAADEIIAQTARFLALGITFEVWSAATIYDHLPGAPAAVRNYLGQDWYEKIFGKPTGPLDGLLRDLESGINLGALRLQDFVSRLNQAESAEIKELKRRARTGAVAAVRAELEYALRSETALALAPATKAEKLRLLAGLIMAPGNAVRIRQLLDEADTLAGDSLRQRAILLLETIGTEALLNSVADDAPVELAEVRAVALLREGRMLDAFGALERFLEEAEPRAETLRLAAIAKLVAGDRDEAVSLAERAVARDPDSRECHKALAMCVFHRALSPALKAETGEWPQPIDQPLVRLSDAGRSDLERAERIFADLMASPDLEGHEAMVVWHFAVLVCMPWRHAETVALLADLQASGTMPIPLLTWALARALPFDRAAAAAQCDARLAEDAADFETLLIRIALANDSGKGDLARKLLEQGRQALTDAGHGAIYSYWVAVLDLESRRTPSTAALKAHPWLRLRHAMGIRAKKHRLNEVAALLATEVAASGDPRLILAATQVLLDSSWHKSAAKAAPFLVNQVGTAEAIAAAASAYYRCERPKDVLATLEHVDAFPERRLPVELERLRTNCLAATGALVTARDTSLLLARTTGQTQDIWHTIQLHLAIGAAPQALALYEEHAQLLTAPAPGHVALARALIWSHPEAARSITRLIAAEAPDEYVTAVFELAARLKLGAEQRKLAGRLQSLGKAGKGGVRLVTIDDVIKLMAERREQAERAMEIYANGHAPVHIFSGFRTGTLASAYLEPLLDPPAPGVPRTLLSARYGRRFDECLIPEARSGTRIIVDISALLTAHGLGMLDAVERAFAPVRIAPDAIAALLAMRSDADPSQPERIDAIRGVIERVDAGEIADQAALSTLDTFSVLWEGDGGEPSATLSFTRLFELAVGSRDKRLEEAAREKLGDTLSPVAVGARPQEGAVLILEPGMAGLLEEVDLLGGLAQRYRVGLHSGEIDLLRNEVAEARRLRRLAGSLTALITRVNTGIEDGTYQTVGFGSEREIDPVRRSFMQVMHALSTEGGIAWVDDRFTSSIDNPKFRIATTVEVIDGLVRAKRLSEAESFALRQRLRAARWLFLPQRGDEIAHHLRAATKAGVTDDTPDLAQLRRAIGHTLVHRRRLQWPDHAAIQQGLEGEVPFLLDNGHAVSDALVAIWRDEAWSVADAEAASAWIVDTLDINLFPMGLMEPGDPRSDHILGVHAGGLVLVAIQLFRGKDQGKRQAAYLDWFWRHYLANMLRIRPEIREGLEGMISGFLAGEDGDISADSTWRVLAAGLINAMPPSLRLSLLRREDLRQALNLPEHGLVSVDDEDFDERDFLDAVIHASDKPRKLKSMSGKVAAIALVGKGENQHVRLTLDGRKMRLEDWVRGAASNDPGIRARALTNRADMLDLSQEGLAQLNAQMGSESDVIARVRLAMARAQASQQQEYADLETLSRERRPFALWNLAVEEPAKVVRHLRLEADIEAAAERLIAERGVAIALRRLGGLPIAAPEALRRAIDGLADNALNTLLDAVQPETSPPWVQLFLADLVLGVVRSSELAERARRLIMQALSEPAAALWQLYISLADFTASECPTRDGWAELSAAQQIAVCWSHATAITEILGAGRVAIDRVIGSLNANRLVSPRVIVGSESKFAFDVANPRWMTPDRLRAHVAAPSLFRMQALPEHQVWADSVLRALVVQTEEGAAPLPRLEVARNALARDNSLPSLLGKTIGAGFESVLPGAQGLFRDTAQGLLEALLSPGAGDDQRRAAWNLMRHMTGDGPLPADLAEVARAASATADLGFDSPDRDLARHALLTFAQLAAVNGWEEAGVRIDAEAARLAPREDEDDVMVLFEIEIWRARLVADPIERTRTLAKALLRLGSFPLLQEQAEIAARHFARSLSGVETEAFVDVLGELFTRR